jgi:ABC-type transport system involved in multi-copper enzyme maturation permease subunit
MATNTATHEQLVGGRVVHHPPGRAGLFGTVRSEFTKIRSVRSTYWTLFALVVVCVGIGALFSWGQTQRLIAISHGHRLNGQSLPPGFQAALLARVTAEVRSTAAASSLFGLLFGQLVIVVLGAVVMTSEYSTGMIRTALTAMPRRVTFFAAKAVVFGAVALVIGLVTSFLAFFAGQAILAGQHVSTTLGHPDVLRQVIGGGLFLAVTGLLSFGIGAMLRHSAGAISTGIGLMFVVTILSNFLPSPPSGWFGQDDFDKWIPFFAGSHIWQGQMVGVNPFSPWVGFAVFCAYAAAATAGGLIMFLRRDA